MRLASSGPFHNLITYGWLFFLGLSGAASLVWKDMSDVGRVVQTVSSVGVPTRKHFRADLYSLLRCIGISRQDVP